MVIKAQRLWCNIFQFLLFKYFAILAQAKCHLVWLYCIWEKAAIFTATDREYHGRLQLAAQTGFKNLRLDSLSFTSIYIVAVWLQPQLQEEFWGVWGVLFFIFLVWGIMQPIWFSSAENTQLKYLSAHRLECETSSPNPWTLTPWPHICKD